MKKLLLALVLLLPGQVVAEDDPYNATLPMICGNTDNLLNGLKKKYGEEIVMMAPSQNTYGDNLFHSLWINMGTSTWTFMVVNRDKGVTCIIASGDGQKMFFPGT